MKIGIDARLWDQTGVGRYIRNLVENLQDIDKKNDYVLFMRDEDKIKLSNPNFEIIETKVKWHSLEEQLKFPGALSKYNLDIVHFPYYSVPIFYNKPFVVTIHDLTPLHFQTGKASTLLLPFYKIKFLGYKFVISQAAKKARKIIAPSLFSKKDIVNCLRVPSSKVEVIYEGTDKALTGDYLEGKKDHFLYVGNAYPHKNLEVLINVFGKLQSDKLILVGKEDYFYKRLKQKVEKIHLEDRIIFFGEASDLELSSLYKNAKALILPSFIEGFGLPALEAMTNKCLVLASNIPTLREVCAGAAIYFDPKDANDLSKKITDISTNPNNFKTYIDKGIKRSGEFSWKKTALKTLRIYESSVSLR